MAEQIEDAEKLSLTEDEHFERVAVLPVTQFVS
jgi:hypothetical protein